MYVYLRADIHYHSVGGIRFPGLKRIHFVDIFPMKVPSNAKLRKSQLWVKTFITIQYILLHVRALGWYVLLTFLQRKYPQMKDWESLGSEALSFTNVQYMVIHFWALGWYVLFTFLQRKCPQKKDQVRICSVKRHSRCHLVDAVACPGFRLISLVHIFGKKVRGSFGSEVFHLHLLVAITCAGYRLICFVFQSSVICFMFGTLTFVMGT
jgi:hypothetical protein